MRKEHNIPHKYLVPYSLVKLHRRIFLNLKSKFNALKAEESIEDNLSRLLDIKDVCRTVQGSIKPEERIVFNNYF